jgi:uncharacterized protein YjeT (DUF2065 family)
MRRNDEVVFRLVDMWDDLLSALALVLVIEGLFPFLSPAGFRKKILAMTEMNDSQIRTASIISMAIGLLLLYLIRQ